MASARITVHGLVQGVGFRYFAQKRAVALNLKGIVRNEHNGDVYVEVVGDRGTIDDFLKLLEKGPAFARVKSAKIEWMDTEYRYKDFSIAG